MILSILAIALPDFGKIKGQLTSEGLFSILNSSKKRTKKIRLNYNDTSGRLVFVRFLEEFEDTKKTFRN